ncbi:hypothetical protein C6575_14810 [Nocardia seriolae]|nr:hypothetical protein C6575_14810 [Nocardia seriolae]
MSTLASTLSQLVSAASTGVQGLSTLATTLQQLDTALQQGDTSKLAQLLGVSEDKVTAALSQIQQQPDKLAELSQLLGLTTDTPATTPASTVNPVATVASAASPVPAGASVAPFATGQAPSFTNLFRSGLADPTVQPVVTTPDGGIVAAAAGAPTAGAEATPVDFVRDLADTLERQQSVVGAVAAQLEVPARAVPVVEQ